MSFWLPKRTTQRASNNPYESLTRFACGVLAKGQSRRRGLVRAEVWRKFHRRRCNFHRRFLMPNRFPSLPITQSEFVKRSVPKGVEGGLLNHLVSRRGNLGSARFVPEEVAIESLR